MIKTTYSLPEYEKYKARNPDTLKHLKKKYDDLFLQELNDLLSGASHHNAPEPSKNNYSKTPGK